MIALKKLYGDELLRLALILSLLRADPNHYLRLEEARLLAGELVNGTEREPEISSYYQRSRTLHPKSLDAALVDYERDVFEEVLSLGRWGGAATPNRETVHTYLLNAIESSNAPQTDRDKTDDDAPQNDLGGDEFYAPLEPDYELEVEVKTERDDSPSPGVTLRADFIRDLSSFDGPLLEDDDPRGSQDPFADDDALDDFLPFYLHATGDSIADENLADLKDFDETPESMNEFKRRLERFDAKGRREDLFEPEDAWSFRRERASTSFTSVGSSSAFSDRSTFSDDRYKIEGDEELSAEDMDLIEVLWKQDVDMGFSLDVPTLTNDAPAVEGDILIGGKIDEKRDLAEHRKAKHDTSSPDKSEPTIDDPWAGLPYTVDLETGEYILSDDLERFDLLEEALQLVDLEDAPADAQEEVKVERLTEQSEEQEDEMLAPRYHPHPHAPVEHAHHALAPSQMEPQQHHHHHHFAYHQNLVRGVSMEQRWQDLAALLALPAPNAPPSDHHHHHLYQQHHHHVNSTLGHCSQGASGYVGPPYAPLAAEKPSPDVYGGANLGSAVAASMNVPPAPPTCASNGGGPPPFYKSQHPMHDHQPEPMYYQNNTNELNATSDGFLSSILNDEDLQLVDMAMNEGMYTMRMLDCGTGITASGGPPLHVTHQNQTSLVNHVSMGTERIDASSDSAVSSMGSERVPSLSDGEWCDAGSDSAQDFHGKMRSCENESRQPPLVAQKKHQMFGKRCFQEQTLSRLRSSTHEELPISDVKYEYEQPTAPSAAYISDVGHMTQEMKYSYTMEFNSGLGAISPATGSLRHNHTYSLPPAPPQPPHRPLARDKRGRRGPETSTLATCGSHNPLSRDEKKARALGIPLSVHDIINLPMDEFNERLSKHDLTETQLTLIRDIRRRGKNKVAAQNCRKRKLDQITSLADEVRDVRVRKQKLQRERHMLLNYRQRVKEQFSALYRHVFQHLRDGDGNPLSSQQFSLQQAADGAVVLVPRASASLLPDSRSPRSGDRHLNNNGTSDDDLEKIKIKQRKSFDQ